MNESPKYINSVDSWNLSDSKKRKEYAQILLKDSYQIEEFLWRKTDTFFSITKQELSFICNVRYDIVHGNKIHYMSILWKSVASRVKPIDVFWNHIFSEFSPVATDQEQTVAGKKFWEKIISTVKEGVYVYGADLETLEAFPIIADTSIEHLYGRLESDKNKRIIVSRDKLTYMKVHGDMHNLKEFLEMISSGGSRRK